MNKTIVINIYDKQQKITTTEIQPTLYKSVEKGETHQTDTLRKQLAKTQKTNIIDLRELVITEN